MDNHNLNLGLNARQLVVRVDPAYHARLKRDQKLFMRKGNEVYSAMKHMFSHIDFPGWRAWEDEHFGDPHEKRVLRINAHETRHANCPGEGVWSTPDKSVTLKGKAGELLPQGKAIRITGDFGTEASLQGFGGTKKVKETYAAEDIVVTIERRTLRIRIINAPRFGAMTNVFEDLYRPPETAFFVVFSDDSCYSEWIDGKVYWWNVDIRKCDLSHGPEAFEMLVEITSNTIRENIEVLIEQCAQDMVVRGNKLQDRALTKKRKCKVRMTPVDENGVREPRISSGTTLTSAINSIHNAGGVGYCLFTGKGPMKLRAEKAGYMLTVEKCYIFEDIQFLKTSPVRDVNGVWKPLLNVGVFIRSLGRCRGDFPGAKSESIKVRAAAHIGGYVRGMYGKCSFRLADEVKVRFLGEAFVRACDVYKMTDGEGEFDDADVYRRYRLRSHEIDEINSLAQVPIGYLYHSAAADAILAKDYAY